MEEGSLPEDTQQAQGGSGSRHEPQAPAPGPLLLFRALVPMTKVNQTGLWPSITQHHQDAAYRTHTDGTDAQPSRSAQRSLEKTPHFFLLNKHVFLLSDFCNAECSENRLYQQILVLTEENKNHI